jgi:hypothetical protein
MPGIATVSGDLFASTTKSANVFTPSSGLTATVGAVVATMATEDNLWQAAKGLR